MVDWHRTRESSRFVRFLTGILSIVERSRSNSTVLMIFATVARTLRQAAANSWLAHALGLIGSRTRQSYLYRWLTAEPEPDVIVIDLRETWTVGPVLAVLDWMVGRVARFGRRSYTGKVVRQVSTTSTENPTGVLSIVLLVAVATNLFATALLSSLTVAGLAVRLLLVAVAIIGTQVPPSALGESHTYKVAVAIVTPPAIEPEGEDNSEHGDDKE